MTPTQAAAHDADRQVRRWVSAYVERFGRRPSQRAIARRRKEMDS